MRIETERLILRRFKPEDTEAMTAINADPNVIEFFPTTMSREASIAHLKRTSDHWKTNGFGLLALELRQTGQMIGFTGLTIPTYTVPASPCVEIGWRLSPDAWGKGLAFEAAQACLQWGFSELGLNEIVSFTYEGNARSSNLMDRLGMHHDIADDFDHPMLPADSALLRHVLYRLARPTP